MAWTKLCAATQTITAEEAWLSTRVKEQIRYISPTTAKADLSAPV